MYYHTKLDKLVAEEIFRLENVREATWIDDMGDETYVEDGDATKRYVGATFGYAHDIQVSYEGAGYVDTKPIHRYSCDWRGTGAILNFLRESGNYCCISLYSDHAYCWELHLTRVDYGDLDKHETEPTRSYDSPHTAVCYTALRVHAGLSTESIMEAMPEFALNTDADTQCKRASQHSQQDDHSRYPGRQQS